MLQRASPESSQMIQISGSRFLPAREPVTEAEVPVAGGQQGPFEHKGWSEQRSAAAHEKKPRVRGKGQAV